LFIEEMIKENEHEKKASPCSKNFKSWTSLFGQSRGSETYGLNFSRK